MKRLWIAVTIAGAFLLLGGGVVWVVADRERQREAEILSVKRQREFDLMMSGFRANKIALDRVRQLEEKRNQDEAGKGDPSFLIPRGNQLPMSAETSRPSAGAGPVPQSSPSQGGVTVRPQGGVGSVTVYSNSGRLQAEKYEKRAYANIALGERPCGSFLNVISEYSNAYADGDVAAAEDVKRLRVVKSRYGCS